MMIDGHVGGSQENATDCLIVDMSQGRPGAVYPRVCGVDLTLIVVIGILSGLSPRVRGR